MGGSDGDGGGGQRGEARKKLGDLAVQSAASRGRPFLPAVAPPPATSPAFSPPSESESLSGCPALLTMLAKCTAVQANGMR